MSADAILIAVVVLAAGGALAWMVYRRGQPAALVALQLFLVVIGSINFARMENAQEDLDARVDRTEVARISDIRAQAVTKRELARNCRVDLKARKQYRIRAIIEKKLVAQQSLSNKLQARAQRTLSEVSRTLAFGSPPDVAALLIRLSDITAHVARVVQRISELQAKLRPRIKILPIPPCNPDERLAGLAPPPRPPEMQGSIGDRPR